MQSARKDRQIVPPGQPLLEARLQPPFRPGSTAGSIPTEKRLRRNIRGMLQMRLRLGLVTVVALGCLWAERQGGRAARQTAAVVRPPPSLQLAACVQATARLPPDFRRSAAVTGYPSFVLNIECPCGPASGRPERTADADRAAGRQKWHGASTSDQRIVERCQPWRYGIRLPPNTLEDPEMRSGFWTERQGRGRCDVSSRADRFEAGVVVSAPCADGDSRGSVIAIK